MAACKPLLQAFLPGLVLKVFVGLVIGLLMILDKVHNSLLNKCSSYVLSCAWIAIEMCWPLLHLFISLSLLSVPGSFSVTPSSVCDCRVSALLASSHSFSSLCYFCASPFLSLCSLSSLLLCMSAAVSQNLNSVGVSVGTSIFLTFPLPFYGPSYKLN